MCRILTLLLLLQALFLLTKAEFELVLLHTNDFHDRVEEISKYRGSCSSEDSAAGKCFGGISRIKSKVDELKAQSPNTILLDGGDQYQGTMWFYLFGGQLLAHFMNLVGYNAIGLGNHEFDRGVDGLVPFVENATFAVLSSNIDLSEAPELQGKIAKSSKVTVGGQTIGVIGYTTTETEYISNPGAVKFTDELTAVQAEADKLMSEGVNKIIAVGHQGFTFDSQMAQKLRGVDIIVGGHSNTFLYTGDAPSNEKPAAAYPYVVQSLTPGITVLVVQDYAYGKYLGRLQVTFDDDGKVTKFSGNPILLDSSVPKDSEMEGIVQSLLPQVEALQTKKIGQTHVFLEGGRGVCRTRECNLGNLICDAMLKQNLRQSDSRYWSDVGIAMMNSGGIRAPIEIGPITVGDAITVQPFRNTIDIVELRGETVLKILEEGAAQWTQDPGDLFGGFFQVSGMRIVYDMTQSAGSRVLDVQMKCSKCDIPQFEPLNQTEVYQIVMNTYLADGGDGYSTIPEETVRRHTIGNTDLDILMDYIEQHSPIIQGLEGRIRFVQEVREESLVQKLVKEQQGEKKCVGDSSPGVAASWPLVALAVLVVTLLVPGPARRRL